MLSALLLLQAHAARRPGAWLSIHLLGLRVLLEEHLLRLLSGMQIGESLGGLILLNSVGKLVGSRLFHDWIHDSGSVLVRGRHDGSGDLWHCFFTFKLEVWLADLIVILVGSLSNAADVWLGCAHNALGLIELLQVGRGGTEVLRARL